MMWSVWKSPLSGVSGWPIGTCHRHASRRTVSSDPRSHDWKVTPQPDISRRRNRTLHFPVKCAFYMKQHVLLYLHIVLSYYRYFSHLFTYFYHVTVHLVVSANIHVQANICTVWEGTSLIKDFIYLNFIVRWAHLLDRLDFEFRF